jgi:hypothetical protein
MRLEEKQQWITAEEIGQEWQRLHSLPLLIDSPEYEELFHRINERDESLYDRYGRPYIKTHPGKWIAIATDGRVLLRDSAGELGWAADEEFGIGNYASRKLAPFPGYEL